MKNISNLNGFTYKISKVSKSDTTNAHSLKSNSLAEYNEMNSIFLNPEKTQNIQTSLDFYRETIINPNDPDQFQVYRNLFLAKPSPKDLLKKYFLENFKLQPSQIINSDFSITGVLLRLKSGYSVYIYTQKDKTRKRVKIKIDESLLKIKTEDKKSFKSISFDCVYGIIIGCETLSFRESKSEIDKKCRMIHNNYNCFSIVSDICTYDMATNDEQQLYDIFIGISFISYHYNKAPKSVPYSKYSLTVSRVILKLQESARARYMTLAELILVISKKIGICKTLKELKRPYKGVKAILEKRFDARGKIYRFVLKDIVEASRHQITKRQIETNFRLSLLSYQTIEKRMAYIEKPRKSKEKLVNKASAFVAFFVPFSTSIFEKPVKCKLRRRKYSSILRTGVITDDQNKLSCLYDQ